VEASANSGAFWSLYNRLRGSSELSNPVGLEELTGFFAERMNPVADSEDKFDMEEMDRVQTWLASLPPVTEAGASFPSLQQLFSLGDVERGKAHLKRSPHGKASGWDGVSYATIMDLDNARLLHLLNECLKTRSIPNAWNSTLVGGVPKKGKDRRKPDGYRPVALESCILRFLTLLIHLRFTDVMAENDILPPSQNGFRAGFRTNNNCFVLRTLVDKAFAEGHPLYVAFVDISNAFPSTSHAVLWETLYDYGMTGVFFDWLRVLYATMTYHVSVNGQISKEFRSLCGVLAGDPLSPTLWNIFLSTFRLDIDEDDVNLIHRFVSHLEHADDMAIISSSPEGLQRHLDQLHSWCTAHFLQVNAAKSAVMIFGTLPSLFPDIRMGGEAVPIVSQWTYIGVVFESTRGNIFQAYYEKISRTAMSSFQAMMCGLERYTGRHKVPIRVAKQLYTALVDCHLIAGADICPDACTAPLAELERIQIACLRRVLGLSNHCFRAFLFTETGLLPIRFRRVSLCLRYLKYLFTLDPTFYARVALEESERLSGLMCSSWWGDLQRCLVSIDPALRLPALKDLSVADIEHREKAVARAGVDSVAGAVEDSRKCYLFRGRQEPSKDGKSSVQKACLRHYLTQVAVPRQRRMLTRLLADDLRPLGFSRLDSSEPQQCSFCPHIDTVEHALFQCWGSAELVLLRAHFFSQVGQYGIFDGDVVSDEEAVVTFRDSLSHWEAVRPLASFVYKVCMQLKQPEAL